MIWGKLYRIAGSAVSAEVPNDLHMAVHRSPPYRKVGMYMLGLPLWRLKAQMVYRIDSRRKRPRC